MQATDKIKDRYKPQTIQIISASVSIRPVALFYQKLVTSIHANISFSYFLSFIIGIMI